MNVEALLGGCVFNDMNDTTDWRKAGMRIANVVWLGWKDAKHLIDKLIFTNIFQELIVTQSEGMKNNVCSTIYRYKHRST
jgi:hypothetical protein